MSCSALLETREIQIVASRVTRVASEGILIECELTLSALETLFAEREGWEGDIHGGSYNR